MRDRGLVLYNTVRYHLFHGSFCVCGAGDCFCVCEPELRTALTTRMVPMRLGLVLLSFTVVSVFAEQEVLSAVNTDSSKMASKRSKLRSTQCEENVDVDSLWVTAFGGAPGGGILRDPLVNSGHVSLSRKRFDDSTALTAPMYGFSGDGGLTFKAWHLLKYKSDNLGFLKQGGRMDGIVKNDRSTFNDAKNDADGFVICSYKMECPDKKCWNQVCRDFTAGIGKFEKDYAFPPFAKDSEEERTFNNKHRGQHDTAEKFLGSYLYLGECQGRWLDTVGTDGRGKCMNCAVYPSSIGMDSLSFCNSDACKGNLKSWLPRFKAHGAVCECWKNGVKQGQMSDCPKQQTERFE